MEIAVIYIFTHDSIGGGEDGPTRQPVEPLRARVSVEQAARFGWERYVGMDGARVGMRTFGESAPLQKRIKKFGFTVEDVVAAAIEQSNQGCATPTAEKAERP